MEPGEEIGLLVSLHICTSFFFFQFVRFLVQMVYQVV